MPIKQNLMPATRCATVDFLESALALYQVRGQITANQSLSIRNICRHNLPAVVSLDQRTPKGAVYVSVNGAPFAEINNRSKAYRVNT
jgi:hypothetical protein